MTGKVGLAIAASVLILMPQGMDAQQPWAIELGALGRFGIYDDEVGIENAFGFGGRVGVFVAENISLEGEAAYAEPELTDQPGYRGRIFVSHLLYTGRLMYTRWLNDDVGLLLGAGYSYDNYSRARNVAARGGGPGGLLGLRYRFSDIVSARLEGTGYFVSEDETTHVAPRPSTFNLGLQAGLSVILGEREVERIVELPVPLFADVGTTSPYQTLYVPVRPGVWQAYQTDLAAVRA